MANTAPSKTLSKVRIDKWLWAARFFKTRSLAKQAIEGGKVHLDGKRIKPSKDLEAGIVLVIRQGYDQKEIEVIALSDKRGPAKVAETLYQETEESVQQREKLADERKASAAFSARPDSKPNTRQRRHIHRFKREVLSDSK